MIYQGNARYPVRRIILHCAALNDGQFDGFTPHQVFSTIDSWHKERGFSKGFGYHGFFMPDGSFHDGRPQVMIGAHCIEANRGSLGWLLIESRKIDGIGLFSDFFTEAQDRSLRRKVGEFLNYGVDLVQGHNDFAPKLCPGFRVADWL